MCTRVYVFTGHYGSGKTETAVNFALKLKEKSDKEGSKTYSEILKYVKNIPEHTVLIMYYLFSDKRETPKKNKKMGVLKTPIFILG